MIINWSFDPVLVSAGPFAINWYALLFVGSFLIGKAILSRIFTLEGVPQENAERLFVYVLLGAIIGARLVHCVFYDPQYYLANPLAIFRTWEGGLASHGGAAGVLIGLWLGVRNTAPQLTFLWIVDRISIPAALGAVFVRIANFLNSEIVGVPTGAGWGVIFETVDELPRHPAQLYEAAAYLIVCLILLAIYRRCGRDTPQGLMFGVFMTLVFSARIVVEFCKTSQAVYESGQFLSVGQYLSLPFVALGIALVFWSIKYPTGFPTVLVKTAPQ